MKEIFKTKRTLAEPIPLKDYAQALNFSLEGDMQIVKIGIEGVLRTFK